MLYDRKMLKQLKENYLTALAMEQTIKEQEEETKNAILAENAFFVAAKWKERDRITGGKKRITNADEDFLMTEKEFARYINLCFEVNKQKGIADDEHGAGYIWSADATELRAAAEKMLLEFALSIMPAALAEQRETLHRNLWKMTIRAGVLDGILRLEC